MHAEQLVLVTVDQARIDTHHIDALIGATKSPASIVGSRYRGVVGVPAIFGRDAFDVLAMLSGDIGARALLRRSDGVTSIDWPDGAFDLDVPRDAAGL